MSTNKYFTKAYLLTSEDIVLTINTYFKNKLLRPYQYAPDEDVIDWSKEPGVQWLGDYRMYEDSLPEIDILLFDDELHLTRAALKYPQLGNHHIKKQVWKKYCVNTKKKLIKQYRATQRLADQQFAQVIAFLSAPESYQDWDAKPHDKKSIRGLLGQLKGLKIRKGGPAKVQNKLTNRPPGIISLPDKQKEPL